MIRSWLEKRRRWSQRSSLGSRPKRADQGVEAGGTALSPLGNHGPRAVSSRCSVRRGSYSWRRLVFRHLEDAPSGFDLVSGTGSRDEGNHQGGIAEGNL
jgi:hypothetical protein